MHNRDNFHVLRGIALTSVTIIRVEKEKEVLLFKTQIVKRLQIEFVTTKAL